MVIEAMTSSALGRNHGVVELGFGRPKVDRPSALRIIVSKCSRAAVVAGEDSTERDVAVDGSGGGRCVARNI
jgi:hypothetical protein